MKTKLLILILSISFYTNAQNSLVPNVPYFYQYNNVNNPGGTCQITTMAMCLKYYGYNSVTPDWIYNNFNYNTAKTATGWASIFNQVAIAQNLNVRCTGWLEGDGKGVTYLRNLLAQGKPVTVSGYLTAYGHVITLVGFNGTQYIANDPAGQWSGQYQYGGYCQCDPTEGKYVYYDKNDLENAIIFNNDIEIREIYYINGYTGPFAPADAVAPTSSIALANTNLFQTANFTSNFTDLDNANGSGVDKGYYSVLNYNGTEWRANYNKGFYCDNFDSLIHPDWTSSAGIWAIQNHNLVQTDETNSNTMLTAAVNQTLSNRYVYHWLGNVGGTGTNRRAGMHFMCSNNTQTNRGDNYFVWLRADLGDVAIYKVTGNTFGSAVAVFNSTSITPNTWYDIKVMYDRVKGLIRVYIDNTLIGSYTDTTPIQTGNYISFRSGNSKYQINNLKVYRSRANTAGVSVGAALTNDVWIENQTPLAAACMIKSLSTDSAGNISLVATKNINIDFTIPNSSVVKDGLSADIDSTNSFTQLASNWNAHTDVNSGIVEYQYAIGTTPLATNVKAYTTTSVTTNFTATGLSLSLNQLYYVSVKSKNGAGLWSNPVSSDGVLVYALTTGINEVSKNSVLLFPNPTTSVLNFMTSNNQLQSYKITDAIGKVVMNGNFDLNNTSVLVESLTNGVYFITVIDKENKLATIKFIKN